MNTLQQIKCCMQKMQKYTTMCVCSMAALLLIDWYLPGRILPWTATVKSTDVHAEKVSVMMTRRLTAKLLSGSPVARVNPDTVALVSCRNSMSAAVHVACM